MDEAIEVLRFEIAERWTVTDMRRFLASVDDLYHLALILRFIEHNRQAPEGKIDILGFFSDAGAHKWYSLREVSLIPRNFPSKLSELLELSQGSDFLLPQKRLEIRRIAYNSPGVTDIAGVGEIIGHIKDLILKIIELKSSKQQRLLNNKELELKNQQLQIENAHSLVSLTKDIVSLAKDIGYSETDLRDLAKRVIENQQILTNLVIDGKIQSIMLLSKTEDEKPHRA